MAFEPERVREDVRRFIVKNFLFGGGAGTLGDAGSLLEARIIDSTGVLELVAHVETEYAIRIEDDEMVPENLDSIANLVAFVGRKLEARASRP
jgi:acyl carrier protein